MIRVNLIGGPKKAAGGKKGFAIQLPTNFLPIAWAAIFVATGAYGYLWYSGLTAESAALDTQIAASTVARDALRSVIAENEAFEARREVLRNRVDTIQGLEENQVSPVVVLDQLSLAVGSIDYIWLNTLQQNNTQLNLSGNGTSQDAVADFITSLQDTGYFANVNLGNMQEGAGDLWSFSLTCEFVPPPLLVEATVEATDEATVEATVDGPEGQDGANGEDDAVLEQ
jgi:type IV pilus assembly protein PilN